MAGVAAPVVWRTGDSHIRPTGEPDSRSGQTRSGRVVTHRCESGDRGLQVGLTSYGTAWDTNGLHESPSSLVVEPIPVSVGWGIEARVRLSDLGLPTPTDGRAIDLYGFIAHLGWGEGFVRAAMQSPAEQSFSQIERFGVFRLMPDGAAAREAAAGGLGWGAAFDGEPVVAA